MTSVAAPTLVLVVEDEALLRYAIAQALRDAGFEVVESGTADEAITYASGGGRVDVVFTDIQLPGRFNGWDVAEQFRAVNADVTIIYTSGNAANRSRRVAGSLFFDKPYDAAAVVQACRQRGVDVTAQDEEEKMQHYFLHIRNGNANVDDPEGADFVGIANRDGCLVARDRKRLGVPPDKQRP